MEETIQNRLNQLAPALEAIAKELYDHPELGGEERHAVALQVAFLKEQGFAVEEGICGWETGYRADYQSGKPGPHVAFLAEYDALPGLGHGCGHNLICTSALGAGAALKAVIEEVGGAITVFGTPAEETQGAKVDFVAQGQFDDVDFAMLCHPGNRWSKSGRALAIAPLQFEYFGKSAHAAASPEMGINALDGAILTINAINALREHVRSDSRIHGIVVEGGTAANIVPDYAKLQYYVRSPQKAYLETLIERVKNCAYAGGLASGARVEISQFENQYDPLMTNEALSNLFAQVLETHYGIVMEEPDPDTGSTDLGNVSLACPAVQPVFDIVGDRTVAGHTVEIAQATVTPKGLEAMMQSAGSMALTALEVIQNPDFMSQIKAEFESANP